MSLYPSASVQQSLYALWFDQEHVGCCLGIARNIVVTAGHHYKTNIDDIGKFTITQTHQIRPSIGNLQQKTEEKDSFQSVKVTAAYGQKDCERDLLFLWTENLPSFVHLRAWLPFVGMRIATLWLATDSEPPGSEIIVSPGVVTLNTPQLCRARGTVSARGSSGGCVIDHYGDRVLGVHLSASSTPEGRVSEFVSSREIIRALIEMEVDLTEVSSETTQPTKATKRKRRSQRR